MEVIAHDDQVVCLALDDKLVSFEICGNRFYGYTFLATTFVDHFDRCMRGVDGHDLPAALCEPYRMTPRAAGNIERAARLELSGKPGYQRMRFVVDMLARLITFIPIRQLRVART